MSDLSHRRPIAARQLPIAQRAADWLVRRRVSANAISVAGMACGLAAGGACAAAGAWPDSAAAAWLLAALLIQLRLAANLLDGMVAVGSGTASPLGELYNELPDRVSDTAVLVGLGLAGSGGWALGLAASLAAMATAYVRAVGRGAGGPSDFSGPMAKQQRMALATGVAVACAVVPALRRPLLAGWDLPALALAVITAGAAATAVRRVWRIAAALQVAP